MDGKEFIEKILILLEAEKILFYDHKIVARIKELSEPEFKYLIKNKKTWVEK